MSEPLSDPNEPRIPPPPPRGGFKLSNGSLLGPDPARYPRCDTRLPGTFDSYCDLRVGHEGPHRKLA